MKLLVHLGVFFIATTSALAGPADSVSLQDQNGRHIECPKHVAAVALPAKAPSRAEYLKLVAAISTRYRARAHAPERIDAALHGARTDHDGADIGALIFGVGAGPSAMYATAWSAARDPNDPLTANNLAVALKDAKEYGNAMAVLLYADHLRAGAPLVTVNRAWVHYEVGDLKAAKPLFETVVLDAPGLTSAMVGLGLVAYCGGDKITAEKLFRKAMESRMPPMMAAAWRSARGEGPKIKPSQPGGAAGSFRLPEVPASAGVKAMASAGPVFQRQSESLDSRLNQLMKRKQELAQVVAKQWNRTSEGGPAGLVVYRRLETTAYLYGEIARLVFSNQGRLGQATQQLATSMADTANQGLARVPDVEKQARATTESLAERQALWDRHAAELAALDREREKKDQEVAKLRAAADRCFPKNSDHWAPTQAELDCAAVYGRQIAAVEDRFEKQEAALAARQSRETDELDRKEEKANFQSCEQNRKFQEDMFRSQSVAIAKYAQAARETLTDFYAFTTPVIENAPSPSLGELLNVERQIAVLGVVRNLTGFYDGLASNAESLASLECFPPSDEKPLAAPADANVPDTKSKCTTDKSFKLKLLIIGIQLSCHKIKLEGGELIIGSIEHDVRTRETTLFLGVGADVGVTGLGGAAQIGGSITFQGDRATNIALESSVSSELGAVTTTVTGRVALEGGADISLENTMGWGGTGVGGI